MFSRQGLETLELLGTYNAMLQDPTFESRQPQWVGKHHRSMEVILNQPIEEVDSPLEATDGQDEYTAMELEEFNEVCKGIIQYGEECGLWVWLLYVKDLGNFSSQFYQLTS